MQKQRRRCGVPSTAKPLGFNALGSFQSCEGREEEKNP